MTGVALTAVLLIPTWQLPGEGLDALPEVLARVVPGVVQQDVPVRRAVNRIAAANGAAVAFVRGIDPTTPVSLDVEDRTVAEVLAEVVQQGDAAAVALGGGGVRRPAGGVRGGPAAVGRPAGRVEADPRRPARDPKAVARGAERNLAGRHPAAGDFGRPRRPVRADGAGGGRRAARSLAGRPVADRRRPGGVGGGARPLRADVRLVRRPHRRCRLPGRPRGPPIRRRR